MKKLILVLSVVAMAAFLLVGCFGTTPVAVTGVTLNQATMTLTAGGATGALVATVAPADASDQSVTWSSSTSAVATVANGIVTPLTVGTTTITVTTVDVPFTATCAVTVTPPVGPAEITATIKVATETAADAEGKIYVKGGSNAITVTFSEAVGMPTVKVGTEPVAMNSPDGIVWHGISDFVGPCDAVLITVGGVCEDLCAAKSVVVDSGKPYAELQASAKKAACEDCWSLTIKSDWAVETICPPDDAGCCGDKCSGLASWHIAVYDENPWEECCELDPCILPIKENDGEICPVTITTDCIPKEYVSDSEGGDGYWVDFFDRDYWVVATLTDNVGNEITYYGEVVNNGTINYDDDKTALVNFLEMFIDPTTSTCYCYAEDSTPAAADLFIGDCDGTPTTECWVEPLEPCPVVTVVPAEPVEGQPATVTIDYTNAVKPVGKVHAYVGPAFKDLPDSVLENELPLVVDTADPYIYVANVVFSEVGDRIIYVVDGCDDCPECTYNITVLPADVCPVVEFLDNTFVQGDVPGYGLTDVDFTVTFANPVEKELVEVFVGDPNVEISMSAGVGLYFGFFGAWLEGGITSPLVAEIDMTTVDEKTYYGTIPVGTVKNVIVAVINHYGVEHLGWTPADYVDPDQPFESLPSDIQYLIHTLGCIPLKVSVLAGDPCCIQTCEYPFILDPIGPFANLEVTLEECEKWYCFEDECVPVPYPGHELKISTETPGECTLEECCNDTCCGLDEWEAWIVPCYFYEELPLSNVMPQGPFDECCDFDEALIPLSCTVWFDTYKWYHWDDECPVEFGPGCVFDWADPFGDHPEIDDMALSDIWNSVWYLYVKMYDCAENTTEYKARLTFDVVPGQDTGDWIITIDTLISLCDDAVDREFGADFCVGPHF